MRYQTLLNLTLSCALAASACAQSPASGPTPLGHAPNPGATAALPPSAASVGPNDPVITLNDACKTAGNACVSSVSREQFEKLINAMRPDMTLDMRRNFATQYGKLLAFADQARALGLENDPKFQQILAFAKDQILVQVLNEHYSAEAEPTEQQIQDYYNKNSEKFVDATLQRIIIPSNPASGDVKKPSDEEQKAYVEKVRQQWLAGGDPATLEKEAMARMGLTSTPDVNLHNQRPSALPPDQDSVFKLKPGEISQPFTDTGAAYIFKMVSLTQQPLSDVKPQITRTLHDQMLHEKIQAISESAKPVLNEAYFGPEKAASLPPGVLSEAQESQKGSAPPPSAPAQPRSAPPPHQ